MSKLSSLEKKALKRVFDKLKLIREARHKESDSVSDCLTDQAVIISGDGEPSVLNKFMDYSRVNDKHISEIFDSLDDLTEHFLD